MNNSQRFKMTLFIVIFLLLIALVIYAVVGTNDEREYYKANGVMPTLTPTPTDTPEPTPVQTVTPVFLTNPPETPAPTPVPTPEPTPEPQPVGMELTKGTITSSDEYKLRIRANYVATVLDEQTVLVEVDVTALHYSLYYNSYKTLNIEFNGESQWLEVPSINCDDNALHETPIGNYVFYVNIPRGSSAIVNLAVKWNFNGSYGGKEITNIMCECPVQIAR